MPNSIALITKYTDILDEVYKDAAVTSILDATNDEVEFVGANAIKLAKMSLQGLGNYSRNSGYVQGDATLTWETMTLSKDRGRKFMIDSMDDEETAGIAFGRLGGEFVRTQVAPELDAYRFAKMAGTSNIDGAYGAVTIGTTDCIDLLDAAEQSMSNNEVPKEGRLLFVSNKFYRGIKEGITRWTPNNDGNVNRVVEMFDNMPVIRVPSNRFNTAIDLLDGTTQGQTAGGYSNVPGTGYSYPIHFMIVHPSAVKAVVKHNPIKVFSPEVNQSADGWLFEYRLYHDLFVEENKVKGIYLYRDTTANS